MKAVSSLTGCDCLSVRMRHNDGTWRQVEARVVVLRGRAGEDRIIGALKDITPKAVRDLPSLQPAQISSLTGLYTLEAGQAIIEKNLLTGLNLQALILVDFRNLDEIEQRHGNRWKNLFLQHAGHPPQPRPRERCSHPLPRRFVHPVCGSVRVLP